MQFMNKGLEELVSTMDKSELHTTSEFLKNYVKNISDNPELLESSTLGFYNPEIPGVTFEIAQPKEKKRKRTSNASADEPRASKRPRCDFLDDEVEVEDDDEDIRFLKVKKQNQIVNSLKMIMKILMTEAFTVLSISRIR